MTFRSTPEALGTLGDPAALHEPLDLAEASPDWLWRALRQMWLIRLVEEKIGDEIKSGTIRCPCHLAIGQEACAVGVATSLQRTDRVFGAHRSHGHYLALGGSVRGLLAEVLGRDTGVSRGMGGSMHLVARDHGLYGTVPIVAGTIPIAVGAGLAARLDGQGAIAVSFFGDGATEEGGFHEALNLAAVTRVPILFVCENNLFSSHLHIDLRQPGNSTCRYAEAHRIPWRRLDGNDVVAVARAAGELIAEIRQGGGPRFLELVTYRWRGHVGWREDEDVGVQRKENLEIWKGRDPIRRLSAALADAGLSEPGAAAVRDGAAQEVEVAWQQALQDPFPSGDALLERVYFRTGPGGATPRGPHD